MSVRSIPPWRRGPVRGCIDVIPFKGHRHMGEVMADERGEKYVPPEDKPFERGDFN